MAKHLSNKEIDVISDYWRSIIKDAYKALMLPPIDDAKLVEFKVAMKAKLKEHKDGLGAITIEQHALGILKEVLELCGMATYYPSIKYISMQVKDSAITIEHINSSRILIKRRVT